MTDSRGRTLSALMEAYPDHGGHYAHDAPGYAHAGVDDGGTKMVEIRHPTRAAFALEAALLVLAGDSVETDPRRQLEKLRLRLMALAGSWERPREGVHGAVEQLTPEACAIELRQALGEPS